MGEPASRSGQPDLRRRARPHRRHSGGLQRRAEPGSAREGGQAALGVRGCRHRQVQAARPGHRQPQHRDRRDRDRRRRAEDPERVQDAALPALGERSAQRGGAFAVSLHRPAPSADAGQHRAASPGHHGDPQLPRRAGLLGDRDAVHDALHPRGRARLPGPQPGAAGQASTPCRNRRNCSSRS